MSWTPWMMAAWLGCGTTSPSDHGHAHAQGHVHDHDHAQGHVHDHDHAHDHAVVADAPPTTPPEVAIGTTHRAMLALGDGTLALIIQGESGQPIAPSADAYAVVTDASGASQKLVLVPGPDRWSAAAAPWADTAYTVAVRIDLDGHTQSAEFRWNAAAHEAAHDHAHEAAHDHAHEAAHDHAH